MKRKKWIFEVLLVAIIILLGFLILHLINQGRFSKRSSTQEAMTENSPVVAETEQTSQGEDRNSLVYQTEEKTPRIAPDFELLNTAGVLTSLSDFQGKVVIINFWATWCPPCRAEMPLFQKVAAKYKDKLIVIAINSGEDAEAVRDFSSRYNQDIIFLIDQDYAAGDLYQVRGLPTSFFIDTDGSLQAMHIGQLDESTLSSYLNTMGIQP